MKTLIAAGGTGGHIYPALALARALAEKGEKITWGGSLNRMEGDVAAMNGFDFKGFDIRRPFEGFCWLFKDIAAMSAIISAMKKERYDRMVCAGGYVTFFFIVAARLLGLKYYLLEQNVIPGRVTRMAASRAEKVFLSFAESEARLGRCNVAVTGNPVRKEIRDIKKIGGHITVLGGSLGARAVNNAVLELMKRGYFSKNRMKVIWITGKRDYEYMMQNAPHGENIQIFAYREDMENVYAQTDFVISRAGATVLAELFVTGTPGILIPYPYAKDDHQTANAAAAASYGLYAAVAEGDSFTARLESALDEMSARFGESLQVRPADAVKEIIKEMR